MDLKYVEEQLKKNWPYGYRWHRKQDDIHDRLTDFVFGVASYDGLVEQINQRLRKHKEYRRLTGYAHNRWYNYWSAMAVEEVFKASDRVDPAFNRYDRLKDFSIDGIKFDHKTTKFPRGFGRRLDYAVDNPRTLIKWLYGHQSRQRRWHEGNRLFIVLYADDGKHWKLKAEIGWLQELIESYLQDFCPERLFRFEFVKDSVTLSDIIWGIQ